MCSGDGVYYIIRDKNDPERWWLFYFRKLHGKRVKFNREKPPAYNFKTHKIEALTSFIPAGAKMSFDGRGDKYHHQAICAGRNPHGDLMIIHHYPSDTVQKPVMTADGGVIIEKLSEYLNETEISRIVVYECKTDVCPRFCRAATLHKAFNATIKGYRLFGQNCENFVSFCCSSSPWAFALSFQAWRYGTRAVFLIMMALMVLGIFCYLGLAEAVCFALFACSILSRIFGRIYSHLVAAITNSTAYITGHRDWTKEDFMREIDSISALSADSNSERIKKTEKMLLDKIYERCQNESLKLEVQQSACQWMSLYLRLRYIHVMLILQRRSTLPHDETLDQFSLLFIDLKVASLVLANTEDAYWREFCDASWAMIFWLILSNSEQDEVDWSKDDLLYAMYMCNDLKLMQTSVNAEAAASYHLLFVSLRNYWRLLQLRGSKGNVKLAAETFVMAIGKLKKFYEKDVRAIGLLNTMLNNIESWV